MVEELRRLHCMGVEAKLREYGCDRTPNLIAELRMALALAIPLRRPAILQSAHAPDLVFELEGVTCTVEVEHKSSLSPFCAVFYPDSKTLEEYRNSQAPWRAAALRLHELLERLPVKIEPALGAELAEPRWSRNERTAQEERCGALAAWLAAQLEGADLSKPTTLSGDGAVFTVTPLSAPPGWISGHRPLAAFRIREHRNRAETDGVSLGEWLSAAIARKASKHHTQRRGLYVVGLVIDEPFARSGHVLLNILLSGLIHDAVERRSYRGVPEARAGLLRAAAERGRGPLLQLAQFDPTKAAESGGLFFEDAVRTEVDAVVALYYTGELQLVPNPFTERPIELFCASFPVTPEIS